MTQFQSQICGVVLGLSTALGCLAYERLVKSCSYFTVGILVSLQYLPFVIAALYFSPPVKQDLIALRQNGWWIVLYLLTAVTGPLWYKITRDQSVMAGAVYEAKYIVMLAIIYLFFGQQKLTVNTIIGIGFALCSIWFISKK